MGQLRRVRRDEQETEFDCLDSSTRESAIRIQLSNRHFSDLLRLRGYDVAYRQFVGGHAYFYWRSTFPDGLIFLVGTGKNRHLELRPTR